MIEVRFYGNGELLGIDDTAPFEGSIDIDASGHYEVYAVVSDDDGNDITSTVQRIVVNTAGEPTEDDMGVGLVLGTAQATYLGGTARLSANYVSPWNL